MSFATLDGWPIVEATITLPLVGPWHVDAVVDTEEIPTGLVLVEAPGLSLAGTVSASSEYGGRVKVRVIAGTGALADVVPARFFRGVTYEQIVTETLREIGETLAPSPLSGVAVAWVRAKGAVGATLGRVADLLGLCWGATDAGDVRLFTPDWAELEIAEAVTIDLDATVGRALVGSTDLSARPGKTIDGDRITCVRHVITPDVVRTELTTEAP